MKNTVKLCEAGVGSYGIGAYVADGVTRKGYVKKLLFETDFAEGDTPEFFYVTAAGVFAIKTKAGELFYGNENGITKADGTFNHLCCATDYNEGATAGMFGALLLGEGNPVLVTETQAKKISESYCAVSAAVRGARVFYADGKDRYRLNWTGIEGMYDTTMSLNGAGYVYLEDRPKGEIIRLMNYDDSMLCVRRYGFSKLQAMGIAENFAMNSSDMQTATIVAQTVALVDGYIYFYTTDGVYYYDGNDIDTLDMTEADEVEAVCACGAGNMYYVYGYIPRMGANGVACIDVERKTISYIKTNADLVAANDRAYLLDGKGCYELVKSNNDFDWFSGRLDFGTGTGKVLKHIYVPTNSGVTVTVTTDRGVKTMQHVKGRASVNMRGNVFYVQLAGHCDLANVTCEVVS